MDFPKRLYSLDVTRGLAALTVVIFHWGHVFTGAGAMVDPADRPFHRWLAPVYRHGELAVDFFFVLSGFVFYWLYADQIARRKIGAGVFTLLRFARLYPLHLATLILVACLQWAYYRGHGGYFVYPHNDAAHFVMNLAFASSWGFQAGHSFNGPVWSVSIEILLYAIFFACCRLGWVKPWQLAVLCVVGLALHPLNQPLSRGVFGFFLGGITCQFARWVVASGISQRTLILTLTACVCAWAAALANTAGLVDLGRFMGTENSLMSGNAGGIGDKVRRVLMDRGAVLMLYPLTILACVFLEVRRGSLGRRLAFLGDISYSSYLLHFPLQLAIILVLAAGGWSIGLLTQGWTLIAFYAVLIPMSLAVFRCFERPAQSFIRRCFSADRSPAARQNGCAL